MTSPTSLTHEVSDEQWSAFQDRVRQDNSLINTPEFRAIVKGYYSSRPLAFVERFLGEHLLDSKTKEKTPFCSMHFEIADLLWDREIRALALAAPRGHAKSTLVSFFFALHEALYARSMNIVIISATEELAVRFLRIIKAELEFNHRLKGIFGDLRSPKWSETEIILANGVAINARGRGAQIRGLKHGQYRPSLIILDDLEDDELVRSESRRRDLEVWFNGTVLPTLDPSSGRLIIIGTILHQDSLLNRIFTRYSDFTKRKYAALKEDGTPLWPERFPLHFLEKIRNSFLERSALAQFFMEYMNDPTPEEIAFFDVNLWQTYDEVVDKERLGQAVVEVAVDLGGGSVRKEADDTAIVVGSTSVVDQKLRLLDVFAMKVGANTDLVIEKLFQINEAFHPQRFLIEKTVATSFLMPTLTQRMQEKNVFLPIQLVTPPRGSGSGTGRMSDAKFQRISALVQPVRNGIILIRPEHTRLVSQAASFPNGAHDDILDALAYLWMFGYKANRQDEEYIAKVEDNPFTVPMYEEIGI